MNRTCFLWLIYFLMFLASRGTAAAQQQQAIALPAGTLLNCTLDEPNFSPATASIDDPVLCHLDALLRVDPGLPRGTYLVGRLVGVSQPGHFFGKGSMTLVFNRIGVGNAELPLTAKVIAVRGYHVTREETIKGRGQATRDAIEWMVPILWPWKVLTLPGRGPQPTLKGEIRFTLRLMDQLLPLDEAGSLTLSSASHEDP